jgi:hypothetical protein
MGAQQRDSDAQRIWRALNRSRMLGQKGQFMKLGTRFPQGLIGLDTGAVRDYIQGIEQLGYDYLTVSDHVLLPDVEVNTQGAGYTLDSAMREPFVLLGFAAALTTRLEFVTSIIILPQRQTVLVAKQAAELDALSGGRLRLGVGLGRIEMEYEALGQDFHTRGRRMEEQIDETHRSRSDRCRRARLGKPYGCRAAKRRGAAASADAGPAAAFHHAQEGQGRARAVGEIREEIRQQEHGRRKERGAQQGYCRAQERRPEQGHC